MYIRIEHLNTGLQRELWEFLLMQDSIKFTIYFDAFYFQTRESTRHKIWHNQSRWERLISRDNNIPRPEVPLDVIEEAKQKLINNLKNTEIQKGGQ